MNPYKILGIPPTASKDEIESAYERIVDTYQIDNANSDDYYLMEDKISEANEAYNTLINDLKYKEIRNLIENEQFISAETELLVDVSSRIAETKKAIKALKETREAAESIECPKKQAESYRDDVKAAMDALRKPVDELELLVDKSAWPIPTYGDLLF